MNILLWMTKFAAVMRDGGWTLRSGGALGADTAFESGAGHAKEIFLPWANFGNSRSQFRKPSARAYEIAAMHHPAWGRLTDVGRALHARNAHQILGPGLDKPSRFVVCWTPNGAQTMNECTPATGGTGTAIRIADSYGVPVFNMARPESYRLLCEFIGSQP